MRDGCLEKKSPSRPPPKSQCLCETAESLDLVEQTPFDQAWLAESHDRLQAYREGKLEALDGEAALNAIESELRKPVPLTVGCAELRAEARIQVPLIIEDERGLAVSFLNRYG